MIGLVSSNGNGTGNEHLHFVMDAILHDKNGNVLYSNTVSFDTIDSALGAAKELTRDFPNAVKIQVRIQLPTPR